MTDDCRLQLQIIQQGIERGNRNGGRGGEEREKYVRVCDIIIDRKMGAVCAECKFMGRTS